MVRVRALEMKRSLPGLGVSLLIIGGCAASNPKHPDLSHAHIASIRVFTSARTNVAGGPISDVTYSSHLPCGATKLEVEVEVRATLPGSSVEQVFTTSPTTFAKRVRDDPAHYVGLGIDDGYAYAKGHWLDERSFALTGIGGMRARREGLVADVDELTGAFLGHELVVRSTTHPEPAMQLGWKQDIACRRSVGFVGDPSARKSEGSDGPALVAYVTKVRTASAGTILFGILERDGASSFFVGPVGTPFTVYSHGADGTQGRAGGDGGSVKIITDERFPDLLGQLLPQSKGGLGGAGALSGEGGTQTVESGDVLLTLIGRSDLPPGMSFLDSPVKITKQNRPKLRPLPPPLPPKPSAPSTEKPGKSPVVMGALDVELGPSKPIKPKPRNPPKPVKPAKPLLPPKPDRGEIQLQQHL